jgi:hypothetical protein
MFLRIATKRVGDSLYRYLQLCESVWEKGTPRNRVLYSFGNLDRISRKALIGLACDFSRVAGEETFSRLDLSTESSKLFGAPAVADHLWNEFALSDRIGRLLQPYRVDFDVSLYVKLMVINRLIDPRSKLGVYEWYPRVYLPGIEERDLPLHHFYRALDYLHKIKEPLEEELFSATRDLFNLEVDLVFYDLTSAYFEGDGPQIADYGYSRDKRPDRKQIVVALACDRFGFPIASEVLPGRSADVGTLVGMVKALSERFAIRRCVFVADSGMVSHANLAALSEAGYEYVVAMKRKKLADAETLISTPLTGYQDAGHSLKVLAGAPDDSGVRTICCYSEPRAEEQRQIREARLKKGGEGLERIANQVAAGRLKDAQKMIERAAKALAVSRAEAYFAYRALDDGSFAFEENSVRIRREEAFEGRYFLLTNASSLSPQDTVDAYYTLQQVERAFRSMKDFLKLRPIYHFSEERVRAHVYVCVLGYLLQKSLEHKLDAAGLDLTAEKALDILSQVHLVGNKLGDIPIHTITRPSPQAAAIVKAAGMEPFPRVLNLIP